MTWGFHELRHAVREKRSAAVISLHLQNIIKTITFLHLLFFFPGHSPEPSRGLAPCCAALQESHKSPAEHPAPSTHPIHPAAHAQPQAVPCCYPKPITHPRAPHPCSSPAGQAQGLAGARTASQNDCNGLARIASAAQVSNLLIRKALQDALEGIMSCQCRAIK